MRKNIFTLILLAAGAVTYAQTPTIGLGIGTKRPQKSAVLDIHATDKGLLVPRIDLVDLAKFQLVGGDTEGAKSEVKGMIVFNKTEKKDTNGRITINAGFHFWNGAEWVHITSEKELSRVATEIRTEVKEQIEKITEIEAGTGDDKSYMVVYDPKNEKLYYLVPDGKGGYTPGDVTFADLVKGSETTTEIKAIIDGKNDDGTDKIVAYVYFNELVVNEWVKDKAGNTIANIPNDRGFKIDVLDVVTHSFDKVIEKNTDKITEVIRETEGNVRVVDVAGKPVLQYKPKGSNDYVNVDLAGVETVTKVDKFKAAADGKSFVAEANLTAPAAGKGVIYYAYQGEKDAEGNSVTTYIDLGKDVETLLKENTTIKETFEKEIQTILDGDGGNVYYGKINGGNESVLYEKKELAGKPGEFEDVVIDISGSVKEVFEKIIKDTTNNKEFTELIKQAAGTKLEKEGVAVDTGNVIITKKVYKQVNTVVVEDKDDFGYDSTFKDPIEIDTNVKFGKLLSATVIDAVGNILVNSATDITIGGDRLGKTLKFHFGSGITYTPIKPGTYQVIIEFVEE